MNYKCYIMVEFTFRKELMLASKLKDCNISHYWYLLDKWFNFQPHDCNDCYDVLMMSMTLDFI